jgi:hypothetical protein
MFDTREADRSARQAEVLPDLRATRPARGAGGVVKLAEIKQVLEDEFPEYYDAHRDQLAEEYSLRDSVNHLGRALRAAVALIDGKDGGDE